MESLPGRSIPGLPHPDASTPGVQMVGQASQEGGSTDVGVDATGTTAVGTPQGDRDIINGVTVDSTVADFTFNVLVDGEAVFDSPQSLSEAGAETFVPDGSDAARIAADPGEIVFEVVSSSGTATTAAVTPGYVNEADL